MPRGQTRTVPCGLFPFAFWAFWQRGPDFSSSTALASVGVGRRRCPGPGPRPGPGPGPGPGPDPDPGPGPGPGPRSRLCFQSAASGPYPGQLGPRSRPSARGQKGAADDLTDAGLSIFGQDNHLMIKTYLPTRQCRLTAAFFWAKEEMVPPMAVSCSARAREAKDPSLRLGRIVDDALFARNRLACWPIS